jgi:hypothetical protein
MSIAERILILLGADVFKIKDWAFARDVGHDVLKVRDAPKVRHLGLSEVGEGSVANSWGAVVVALDLRVVMGQVHGSEGGKCCTEAVA